MRGNESKHVKQTKVITKRQDKNRKKCYIYSWHLSLPSATASAASKHPIAPYSSMIISQNTPAHFDLYNRSMIAAGLAGSPPKSIFTPSPDGMSTLSRRTGSEVRLSLKLGWRGGFMRGINESAASVVAFPCSVTWSSLMSLGTISEMGDKSVRRK